MPVPQRSGKTGKGKRQASHCRTDALECPQVSTMYHFVADREKEIRLACRARRVHIAHRTRGIAAKEEHNSPFTDSLPTADIHAIVDYLAAIFLTKTSISLSFLFAQFHLFTPQFNRFIFFFLCCENSVIKAVTGAVYPGHHF